MESPFPVSTSAPGEGHITAKVLPSGISVLESVSYQYPLKLISPASSGHQPSVLVFLLSYGGGLVGGDAVDLSIRVLPDARLSIVTQGHTKIFPSASPHVVTRQRMNVHVGDGASFCLLPDPVQPFDRSVYEQTQVFTLTASASVCLLDWVTQGRVARGENWDFTKWVGRNEVWLANGQNNEKARLHIRDVVILDGDANSSSMRKLKDTMHGLSVFGTLILRGSRMKSLSSFFLSEFGALPRIGVRSFGNTDSKKLEEANMTAEARWRLERLGIEGSQGVLWSAASMRDCVVVKFGAPSVEAGRVWIGSMLSKEGTITKIFGDQALMCVA
jgi:urease accessory protein